MRLRCRLKSKGWALNLDKRSPEVTDARSISFPALLSTLQNSTHRHTHGAGK